MPCCYRQDLLRSVRESIRQDEGPRSYTQASDILHGGGKIGENASGHDIGGLGIKGEGTLLLARRRPLDDHSAMGSCLQVVQDGWNPAVHDLPTGGPNLKEGWNFVGRFGGTMSDGIEERLHIRGVCWARKSRKERQTQIKSPNILQQPLGRAF